MVTHILEPENTTSETGLRLCIHTKEIGFLAIFVLLSIFIVVVTGFVFCEILIKNLGDGYESIAQCTRAGR